MEQAGQGDDQDQKVLVVREQLQGRRQLQVRFPRQPPVQWLDIEVAQGLEKLTEENYMLWKRKMISILQAYGVHHVVRDRPRYSPRQGIPDYEEALEEYQCWLQQDYQVQAFLITFMRDSEVYMVMNCENAYEIWRKVEARFSRNWNLQAIDTKRKLYTIKQGKLESTDAYLERVDELVAKIGFLGGQTSSFEVAYLATAGLQSRYHAVAGIISGLDEDKVTLDRLRAILQAMDRCLSTGSGETGSARGIDPSQANFRVSSLEVNSAPKSGIKSKTKALDAKKSGETGKKQIICWACKRKGHFSSQCPVKVTGHRH